MKLLSITATIALSALALAGAHGVEPTFQKLDMGKTQSRAKAIHVDPVAAPRETVLTASVQPDGSLLTLCSVESHQHKARLVHTEHQQ